MEAEISRVMVGREGRRAYFIDLLTNHGARGAYLITGRRGMGKSSFVRYCLEEYRRNIFMRFHRSNIGKSVWDWLMLALFVALVAWGAGMLSGVAAIVFSKKTPLFNAFGLFVSALCLYPAFFGLRVISELLSVPWPKIEGPERLKRLLFQNFASRGNGFIAVIFTLILVAFAWSHLDGQKELLGAHGLSRAMYFAAGIAFISVFTTSWSDKVTVGHDRLSSKFLFGLSILFFASIVFLLLWVVSEVVKNDLGGPNSDTDRNFSPQMIFDFASTLLLLACAFLVRGIAGVREGWKNSIKHESMQVISREAFALLLAGVFILAAMAMVWFSGFSKILGTALIFVLMVALVCGGCAYLWFQVASGGEEECNAKAARLGSPFAISPTAVMAAKAAISILISLQLVLPAAEFLSGSVGGVPPFGVYSIANSKSWFWHLPPQWYGCIVALFALFFFLEYECITKPLRFAREEATLAPFPQAVWREGPGRRDARVSAEEREHLRRLETLTLPWVVFHAWLPTLTVTVNLGFESLDHRSVVHSMLAGLRNAYHKEFLAWNSRFGSVIRATMVIFALLLTHQLADFAGQIVSEAASTQGVTQSKDVVAGQKVSDFGIGMLKRALGSQVGLGSDYSIRGIDIVVFILVFWGMRRGLMVFPVIPYWINLRRIDDMLDSLSSRTVTTSRKDLWKPAQWIRAIFVDDVTRQTDRGPVDARTVELAFMDILNELQRGTVDLPGKPTWGLTVPAPEVTFVFDELDKLGVRAETEDGSRESVKEEIEIKDMERLRSLALHRLISDMKRIISSAPARFIFVGGRLLHDEWLADQTSRQPLLNSIFIGHIYLPSLLTDDVPKGEGLTYRVEEYLWWQYRRSRTYFEQLGRRLTRPVFALRHLDLVSEQFVGPDDGIGRPGAERDDVKRQRPYGVSRLPVLDIILKDEIRCRCCRADRDSWERLECQNLERVWRNESYLCHHKGSQCPKNAGSLYYLEWQQEFVREFIAFLTYRSVGNPKKLRDLLASFVRLTGRALSRGGVSPFGYSKLAAAHVLEFGDIDIFRIQMVATIFQQLEQQFGQGMLHRDDKVVFAATYFTDFLFKFHRRAFAWADLERIDELAHIHRAPDIRSIMKLIVDSTLERFLHRVTNGMYAFRFRSDWAREIDYISRQSGDEMAAFNFTLDESQALKAVYLSAIKSASPPNPDVAAALGELYEFDQEYEAARYYFRLAIELADDRFVSVMAKDQASGKTDEKKAAKARGLIRSVLAGEYSGLRNAAMFMSWGIQRLRLFLQVGMTFEQSRNMEKAEATYRSARLQAYALLHAYAGRGFDGRELYDWVDGRLSRRRIAEPADDEMVIPPLKNRHALKHLAIIYQPLFASAWVVEKIDNNIDASASLVEREIMKVRRVLPYVNQPLLKPSTPKASAVGRNLAKPAHSDFALIMAELHKKTGDLYFFKGRQRPGKGGKGGAGYLQRAHIHYSTALHELRRLISYRVKVATRNLGYREDASDLFAKGQWPSFVGLLVGQTLLSLSECVLAQVSFLKLVEQEAAKRCPNGNHRGSRPAWGFEAKDLEANVATIEGWFETFPLEDKNGTSEEILPPDGQENICKIDEWIGKWNGNPDDWKNWPTDTDDKIKTAVIEILNFKDSVWEGDGPQELEKLIFSLTAAFAGARLLRKAGYNEDAGYELLQVCETITGFVWWSVVIRHLKGPTFAGTFTGRGGEKIMERVKSLKGCVCNCWPYLVGFAAHTFREAEDCFVSRHDLRPAWDPSPLDGAVARYRVGTAIPVVALTQVCSLGIAVKKFKDVANDSTMDAGFENCFKAIHELAKSWTGKDYDKNDDGSYFVELLEETLARHRYPMLNRLKALKVIIDQGLAVGKKVESSEYARLLDLSRELFSMNDDFAAPLHFTPFHLGSSMAAMAIEAAVQEKDQDRDKYARIAIHHLTKSLEMFSLGRTYYETISELYYLYDDFSDRETHYNQAIQMAVADYANLLLDICREFVTPTKNAEKVRATSEPAAAAP